MACSKIFSGDIPELTNEIIEYFRNDFSTLYSCILVNRLFCRIAIPILWEDPFSIPTENYDFIKIYLYNLNDDDKIKLNNYGIDKKLFSSNTLFNYPSYIKSLNIQIDYSIESWVAALNNCSIKYTCPSDSTRLIYKSLFKIFIENGADLHTFVIAYVHHDYLNDASELILKNPNFIYNIKNLKLEGISDLPKIDSIISLFSLNCKSISTLHFQFSDHRLNENFSSCIINSQQSLKTILFKYNSFPLYHSLLSLKNFNCSNTLKKIIFYGTDFKDINILKEVFEQLNCLESIHILYCHSLNYNFIQQIINITSKPFKLRSLYLIKSIDIKLLQLLLQKSKNYLENIGFRTFIIDNQPNTSKQLVEKILSYCKKINFFDFSYFYTPEYIFPSFDLIKNSGQNLNYLSIEFHFIPNVDIRLSSIVLKELGQILPSKLEYLKLSLSINTNDFKIFLDNFQNTFIKKLVIRNKIFLNNSQNNFVEKIKKLVIRNKTKVVDQDILYYIEKHIMKKRKVKYLAFRDDLIGLELYLLKDQVKKFESYNIKVQKYDDLNINWYKYIEETY
ncbi:hypothetical protein RhiirA1_463665 [Rhizophagus irregularis]|uniref:F-box domain-containing protein n=1 Tax=Rhizophagus irregularis TaxID=588596 RepID=A0A2N0RJK9_9GLOM|nr:hypothetical protein RhiirA1_463665 [Rhizophagus irregularis]CAB5192133.1 unnamed protein product [Rhizophagus irregularis]